MFLACVREHTHTHTHVTRMCFFFFSIFLISVYIHAHTTPPARDRINAYALCNKYYTGNNGRIFILDFFFFPYRQSPRSPFDFARTRPCRTRPLIGNHCRPAVKRMCRGEEDARSARVRVCARRRMFLCARVCIERAYTFVHFAFESRLVHGSSRNTTKTEQKKKNNTFNGLMAGLSCRTNATGYRCRQRRRKNKICNRKVVRRKKKQKG